MTNHNISIIIPVYNVEPYVEDCIRSVMRQTYTGPMECIVVDDCGTDNSMAVVEKLVDEYSGPIIFKVLHHEHNRGLSAARNTGMDAATGDYIFFLDSDDKLTDNCLKILTEPVLNNRYDVIVGDLNVWGSSCTFNWLKLKLSDNTVLLGDDILNSYRTKWNMMAQNKLYLREFLEENHLTFLEGLIHEDELWSFQIACLATSLYAVKRITYDYLIRKDSISHSEIIEERNKNYSIIIEKISIFLKKKGIYNKRAYQLLQEFMYDILVSYNTNDFKFSCSYRHLRQLVKPSLSELLRIHKYHVKRYIRDLHYFLPQIIAKHWVHYFINRRQIKKKNQSKRAECKVNSAKQYSIIWTFYL